MKQQKRHRTRFISTILLLVTAGLLVFLGLVLYDHEKLQIRFDTLINWLQGIEAAIAALDSDLEIIICIFALYVAKCRLPIPMGFLCMISGIVFPLWQAFVVNVVFSFMFFTIKYLEGRFLGAGWTGAILGVKQLRFVRDWIQFKGTGNPYILFVSRLVPSIPLGLVSRYYGSLNYDFVYYSCLSLLGLVPSLFVYTKIGSAIFNPFSVQFIVLLIIIVVFTGASAFLFNVFYGIKSKQMNQTLLIYSEKEKYKIVL